MRILFKLSLIIALVFGGGGISSAAPIWNVDGSGDPIDTLADGTSFGSYRNSGKLLFVGKGNNLGNAGTLQTVEELVEEALGFSSSFKLTITTDVTWTKDKDIPGAEVYDVGNTGIWDVPDPVDSISFYAVKAGNAFAMYQLDPPDGSGSWSTWDIWNSDLQGTGGEGGLVISHFSGYNPTAPVPEPATMLLLGCGLVGLAGVSRKKLKK